MGLVSRWSLANHSNSVFPGGAHIAQPRWVLARGTLGSGWTRGVSFRPFPNSSGWWWLISSIFLIRISCHKTAHADGYYGAWPGWAVSISVLPLTGSPFIPLGSFMLAVVWWLHCPFFCFVHVSFRSSLMFIFFFISNYKLLDIGLANDRRVASYLNSLI